MQKDSIIYLNERPLIIVPTHQAIPNKYKDAVLYTLPDQHTVESTLQALETGKLPAAIFINPDTDAMLETVKGYFNILVAAGGLITNQEEEILLMFRRGKWDLPKGKQDEGENLEACALREVEEETGLHSVTLEHKITETLHFYTYKEKKILKHTYWYKMKFTGTELTIPQIEEDIVDIQWVKPEHLSKYLKFSYQNITDVFEKDGYPV
ncbi:ADP-ribose pyrophosphatase YjhB, NUDIX family [Chitinophaga sp. YR573]|uniref:NUDIX hydrolase n=1 Tax=Chitinophaga sp. YR573 TaxID=1881040 RepID=UPI0008D67F5A|nr:NUDIX domain-containing protein [Chitinophaga sp. YR573]SEV90372.1 ADP-ribose pyrophosphatase YjhB, NUDIX family [Chitinophaga sp. YR573]